MSETRRRRLARPEVLLVAAAVAGSFLVYAPFLAHMSDVYRFWDGPNYLTIARTLYDVQPDNPLLAYVRTPRYFFVHLPMYPLLVRAVSFFGYQQAMLLVSIVATCVATILFYRLCRDVWKLASPEFLTVVFLFLPPRWLLYRSTGSTEAVYIAFTLAAILFFQRSQVARASIFGAFATLTRISGLMIAPAFAVVLLLRRKRLRSMAWLVLIPAVLAGYFLFCAARTSNFFEYFSQHGEKVAAFRPFGFLPVLFQKGLYHQAEFHILLALVYGVGTSRLRPFPVLFWYCVFELGLHLFISTEDWSRYFLAMAPFALVVGFREVIDTRAFRWIFAPYVVVALYYAWNVIPSNGCRPDIYVRLLAHLGLVPDVGP
ncbi:MAG TPA: hypothetical protein VGQ75_08235 [Thermoanaerobaculia bacterium]|nr:hypothetical protein [Thermoanaerobaculia bacterium]